MPKTSTRAGQATTAGRGKAATARKAPGEGAKKKKKKTPKRYSAPALEKGLDILELFAQEPTGMIKSEVARRLSRTTSEVFRMLICLQERGYITQGEDEKFRLTLRLFELAQQHPPTQRLLSEAMPVMHEVTQRVNQSCHLAVVESGTVIILAGQTAPSNTGFFIRPGSQVDLMQATSGHVILAHQSEFVRGRSLEMYRQRGGKANADFEQQMEQVRRQGYEMRPSYQVQGVVNMSFPIFDTHGEAIAALSVPFLPRLDDAVSEGMVLSALRKGARQLSRAMGSTGV